MLFSEDTARLDWLEQSAPRAPRGDMAVDIWSWQDSRGAHWEVRAAGACGRGETLRQAIDVVMESAARMTEGTNAAR